MNDSNAMTAIAVSKSLLKEYETRDGRTVYLDANSEFQIKLFNPTSTTIGAKVFINEECIGSPIIIRPGEIVWLERYLNEAKKFKFDVYEVDMSQNGVSDAIKNNGQIKVMFYREKKKKQNPIVISNNTLFNTKLDNISYPTNFPTYEPYTSASTITAYTAFRTKNIATMDSYSCNGDNKLISGSIKETGRIDKGGYSDQKFNYVDIDLEAFSFQTDKIKILPKSQKFVSKDDLEKIYCHECGRKIKSKFKYCPFCGAKQ